MTGKPFSATAAGTNAGASATQAAGGAYTEHFVTSFGGHTDTDSIVTVESPAATILWQSSIDISVDGTAFNFYFGERGIPCGANGAAVGKIATSTTDCQANITGYTIP